ncbi:hypothetical protein WH7805_10224 [Synechococcus sp. WH 7805]|nr:hypothetical protein WH7805_10224 [Synechococcus sp. WH 7805]
MVIVMPRMITAAPSSPISGPGAVHRPMLIVLNDRDD